MARYSIREHWELLQTAEMNVFFDLHSGNRIRIEREPEVDRIVEAVETTASRGDILERLSEVTDHPQEWLEEGLRLLRDEHGIVADLDEVEARNDLSDDEFRRFDRQLHYFGALEEQPGGRFDIHESIATKRIAVLGLGSMAQWILPGLVYSGFRRFTIVDFDEVEAKNLVGQPLFRRRDIGDQKTAAVRDKIVDMRPETDVRVENTELRTVEDVREVVADADLVLHCADYPRYKIHRVITDACTAEDVPNLNLIVGRIGPFHIPGETACYGCLEAYRRDGFDEYDSFVEKLAYTMDRRFPGLHPTSPLTGGIATMEVVRHFTPVGTPFSYSTIRSWDAVSGEMDHFDLDRREDCRLCWPERGGDAE
jgi:molybdopterin/thiamine biosynthesis adenylyltransferase